MSSFLALVFFLAAHLAPANAKVVHVETPMREMLTMVRDPDGWWTLMREGLAPVQKLQIREGNLVLLDIERAREQLLAMPKVENWRAARAVEMGGVAFTLAHQDQGLVVSWKAADDIPQEVRIQWAPDPVVAPAADPGLGLDDLDL